MEPSIEDNAADLQKKTAHVIVEQKVILAKQDINNLLDEILFLQEQMRGLSEDTGRFIDTIVSRKTSSKTYTAHSMVKVNTIINSVF